MEWNDRVVVLDHPIVQHKLAILRDKHTPSNEFQMCIRDRCQVHRGGVSVRAVDDRTCEVRRVPGLYVVGEALDVDAACGGFNLHWAWASGLLAGWSAAERIADLASLADASGSSGSERREGAPCSNSIEVQGSSRVAGGNLCTSMNCARTPSRHSEPARQNKRGRA